MKLKAWDNHEKRWAKTHEIEGELFINPEVGDTGVFYIHDHSASGKLHYTIVKSTGLKDKHRKEMWEGDKVNIEIIKDEWRPDEIIFSQGMFMRKSTKTPIGWVHPLCIEVIGNIFEGGE